MKTLAVNIHRVEFEGRIFISLGIVLMVYLISFLGFPGIPGNMALLGNLFGLSPDISIKTGFIIVSLLMMAATILRMWAGSVLASEFVMSFKVRKEVFINKGPYKVSRNPIYLADLIAFFGFAFCLSPVGFAMPVLIYLHYNQLITYEETNLEEQFGEAFREYRKATPRFLPNLQSIIFLFAEMKSLRINRDGFRHNALYLLFIPGLYYSQEKNQSN